MKHKLSLTSLLLAVLVLFTSQTLAEVKFSGYGSIVVGKTFGEIDDPLNPGQTRDEIFTADFYDVGQYDNDLSFKPETVFAIQARSDLGEGLSVTAQLVAKGTDDFEPEFDWYYITYKPTDDWTLLAGRRNIPMYYFSEFSEVGYAYPWMRPPSNLYWWQVTQFNSVQAIYTFDWGDLTNSLNFFYGNEYSDDNKEMLFYDRLFGGNATRIDEIWTNITGFNWNMSGEMFDLRFVYFRNDRDRDTYNPDGSITVADTYDQFFVGLGGVINLDPITLLFDYNYVEYDDVVGTVYPTWLLSAVYTIGDFQPYISYSKADHEQDKEPFVTEDLEEHYVLGIGLRYNFHPQAALKIQYDKFKDQGDAATFYNFHGDAENIAIGVDFIF
ncbi:porin [Aestuariibacter sp. AA17]|uniref:Porin n=1 Tax=Fluctibacter corallii TaxID=2984329 RepID=A0ABT3A4R8_9ALTE|nr:porin [Aestuariibacter sp. AA17]MCV2883539.1 porin [Aestuariibacter sp. AA17]